MQNETALSATIPTAIVAPTAKPVAAKPTAKPVAAKPTAKPVKPVKPDVQPQRDANRAIAATVYNGASLTAHKRDTLAASVYIARVNNPAQRIGKSGATERDESGLHLLARNLDKAGAFDPVALAFDAGALSRLASGGFVSHSASGGFRLTKAGTERAALVAKRAAKRA